MAQSKSTTRSETVAVPVDVTVEEGDRGVKGPTGPVGPAGIGRVWPANRSAPLCPVLTAASARPPVRWTTTTAGGDRQVGARSPGMITGVGGHAAPR